jgi:transposase
MDTAQAAPDTIILAEDEASLYLQATLQVVWHPKGQTPMVKVHPGRNHLHFYGALDLQSGRDLVMRSPLMTAATSALFLDKLLAAFPARPILLFWDRAPWHRGPLIQAVLDANPRLEIVYFPTAAPDLNPQEHVWKATREEVSHNHTEPKLDRLADRFEQHLTSTLFPCSLLELHDYPHICMMSK